MALWFLLIFMITHSIANAIWQLSPQMRARDEAAAAATKDMKLNGFSVIAIIHVLALLPMPFFWVWWAFSTDDWRYAAFAVIPWVLGILTQIIKAAVKRHEKQNLRNRIIDAALRDRGVNI